tara:strand:- start:12682 stop:15903 length:3222 start_codon:yes stop_codon:yes gene_type:complete
MANDFNINEFKLRDPVRSIPDGLKEPIKDKTPGFFQSLRSPYDLWLEESLPASLYQWMTGNTKKKQAQEALEYIRNNPQDKESRIYKEAERKLNRFGYLLDDGPMHVDFKEVGNMIKSNPKLFGAELVNMIMADPWLLFMPLGWGRLGRGVVNGIRLKRAKGLTLSKVSRDRAKVMSDLKVGTAATLGVPFAFSTTWQLGEKAEVDPKRTTVETTIGATAGAIFSVGFAGAGELARRMTRIPRIRANQAVQKVLEKHKLTPEKLVDFNEQGIYRSVDDLINEIRKQQRIISDPKKFEVIKADITAALRTLNENGKDMAFNTALKRGASIGAIFGTAQFLTADDDKLLATAKGFGVGAAIYTGARLFGKQLKKAPKEFDEAALSGEAALDAMKMSTVKLNSAAQELSNTIKRSIPDAIDSRRRIFYYLTKAKVHPKTFKYNPKFKPIAANSLTKAELDGAKSIEKVFNEYYKIFGDEGRLVFNKRANYLPLLWNEYNPKYQPFRFIKDFDSPVVTGPSAKFQFAKRGMFGDINHGLQRNYTIRKGMDDPAELVRIYGFAAGKALATRSLITNLERTSINQRPLLIRNNIKKTFDEQNYTEFKHPYFADQGETALIHKGMVNSLRMVFDAADEGAFMGALFTTNLMMKRLAVGFSFFHAGALVESLWFAGAKWNNIKKILDPRAKPEILSSIRDPKAYIKDYDHAITQLRTHGYEDVVRFGQGSGLQISIPEDVGFDRFYYNIRGVDTFLKRHFGISTGGKVEDVFRWFDRITWDRVFTAAKLHTFLTVLDQPTLMRAPNNLRLMPGDTQSVIYRKATQAAQFTNDAFGGQNWEQIANRIQTPTIKRMMQTTFAPGSRGYMQLLLFAPDWTISNVRIIAKSLPSFESDPALRRMYQYYFARAALTYAAAGSALNYIFSGHSILENTDPTRIDLGDGQVLTFSKQLMEPFHWITAPQSTGLKKIGSLPRTTIEVLTNKQYLTTKWSPNITKKDDEAIEKGLKIGGHVGRRFLPIWLQTASQSVAEGLERDGLSVDLASDIAVDFVLGQSGHPRYQGPRYTQYKTKGLVRSPYETLF